MERCKENGNMNNTGTDTCVHHGKLNVRDTGRPAFMDTPYPKNRTVVDYIFVNQSQIDVLMKTKVVDFDPVNPDDLPVMEKTIVTDTVRNVILKPKVLFPDPFRGGHNKIALCELYDNDTPFKTNTRHTFQDFLDRENINLEEPWMGFEQEYFIMDRSGHILGSDIDIKGINCHVNYGPTAGLEREIAEQHFKACMHAGLSVYGMVKETNVGQWEYQLGPTDCLRLADELIVSRYLLHRIAESFDVTISFTCMHYKDALKTKPMNSVLHLNYSTKATRAENGIETIYEFIRRLSAVETTVILPYYDRANGLVAKSRLYRDVPFDFKDFNTKRQYFRIPVSTQLDKRGYFEERRPSSDCDPYTAMLGFLKCLYTQELTNSVPSEYVEK